MAYLYKDYCYSNPQDLADVYRAQVTIADKFILSVEHVPNTQFFDVTYLDSDLNNPIVGVFTASDCQFEDNAFPPKYPFDLAFLGIMFVACLVPIAAAWSVRSIRRLF